MSPPSEHECHAEFLRHYAESEVALHTFVRSLVPTRQMDSEVMQEAIAIFWQKFSQVDDFRRWALGVPRLAVLLLMGAD
jgi:hypothetical protein